MKLLLFHVISPRPEVVNKDLAGGMGTATSVGTTIRARLLQAIKKNSVVLPLMTTGYLASLGKKLGWKVTVITTKGHNHPVENLKADLALVPTSMVDSTNERDLARKLKKRGLKVGVYGTFASYVPEFFLDEVDFVIKGEAESALMKLTAMKSYPKGLFEVEAVEDIDNLPFPDWDQFPHKTFSYAPSINVKPLFPLLSSRGCPYSCFFYCPYPMTLGRKWRARSPKNVVDEIVYLIHRFGARGLDFRDAIFSLDRNRTIQIAEEILRRNVKIIWSCETRLDRLDTDLIDILYEAGVRNINCGVESFSYEVLKNSRRIPITHEHQEKMVRHMQKKGITTAAFYIIGLMTDTPKTVRDTIEYAKFLNTNIAQATISTPYPGTGFHDQLKKEGKILSDNWEEYDQFTPTHDHPGLTKQEMLDLKEKMFVEYYFRPQWIRTYLPKYLKERYLGLS